MSAGSAPGFGNPGSRGSWVLLPSPGPSPPLSIPRFGFYKYMKMDEEEEDPRQRAFLFLGPDSESPASLGTGPSSRHPRWQLIPSELWLVGMAPAVPEAPGGVGLCRAASLRAPLQASRLAWPRGDVGCSRTLERDLLSLPRLLGWPRQWAVGNGPGVESGDVHGAWGCSWGTRGCPGQFAAWQSPGRSGLLLDEVGLVPRFEVGISSSNWSCQPRWAFLGGHSLVPQLCSLTSATHRLLSCWRQALPPCLGLMVLISAFAP